jgi:hypothetical protein
MSPAWSAIDALVDALAELPEHELEGGGSAANRLGLRILCELGQRYPGIVQPTGPFAASRPERPAPLRWQGHAIDVVMRERFDALLDHRLQ